MKPRFFFDPRSPDYSISLISGSEDPSPSHSSFRGDSGGSGIDSTSTIAGASGIIQSLSSASEMEKNPFVQAGALSTDLGEIPRASPFPNPFDQAGAIDGGVDQLKDSCRFIPLCHILKATNDFDDALVTGTGGFGKVYKASIDDGDTTTVVAIKRLSAESKQGAEEFWTELKLLSKFRHANLVSLIGYCDENQEMIIVYEYIARGTLANHLYKTSREESGGSRSHLTWEQRLNICLDVACGLDYLHNGTLPGIIHRDVKSTNILLDDHLVAKVSDLGLSKSTTTHTATHVSTCVKGTFGYLDPDYFQTMQLTKKSDVYAFGVVLFEVLCGRPAIKFSALDEERVLSNWARMNIKEGTLDRIIDPSLNGDTTPDSLKYFAELANKCLHIQPNERPTMTEVVKSLQIALVSHERQGRLQGTFAKAFDDFMARSKETFMIHQENIVKKEEGFINEHLPDHVFGNSKKNEDNDETVSKIYNRKGSGNSMELKHWATFKKLGMDPGNKNNRAYQSGVLLSNSKKKKKIEALKRLGGSLIPTLGLEDYNTPLSFQALSGLSNIFHGFLSGCGDGQIILLNTNHNHIDRADVALQRPSSPQPKALPDGGEIVLLDSSDQKPSVSFDATNNRAYQSDILVSNSEEKNTGEASRRRCIPEGVLSLVDSMTSISSTYFDAPDNSAHFVREYQSGPIVFNSEKKDTGEGLNRECLTKSALSLDDSTKPWSLPDFDATENKAVKVYTCWGRGCWHSMEELEQGTTLEELGMDPENVGIISDLLRFVSDKEEFYKKAGKDWKTGYLLYDSPGTDRSSLITAMANFLEFDIYHLDLAGLTSISELTNVLVSIQNRSLIAIKDFDQWAGKLPDFETELTFSGLLKIIHGLLSSCGDEQVIVLTTNHNHIGGVDVTLLHPLNIDLYIHTSSPQPKALPDGREIVLLDSSEQKP
ncbi:uncharacterized protein LOC131325762 [Rhododendron vialii]|uniref:uncharacterized protein LOC131325762 n=1 Tax=Rhododendron vialii TaxID=182163 RepID=UPI00265F9412|nr:uncharacterized protein LOC131325762 [Rhododendron vialii]